MQLHIVEPEDLREFVESHDDLVSITHDGTVYIVVTATDRRGTVELEVR